MKRLLVVVGMILLASIAMAQEKSVINVESLGRVPCNLVYVAHDWDFGASDHGFTTTTCDTGGAAVWAHGAYGAEVTADPPGGPQTVWGTALGGDYPSDSGEGLVSPPFLVTEATDTMEILHWIDMESVYDGGNVSVGGTVIPPIGGYPAQINPSTGYYAWCVDEEDGFTDYDNLWEEQCFDLSAYDGQTIQVEFDFGSDSSVTYAGWYLAYVKVGDPEIPVELQTITVD